MPSQNCTILENILSLTLSALRSWAAFVNGAIQIFYYYYYMIYIPYATSEN